MYERTSFTGSLLMAVLIRSIASCKDSSVFLFLLLGATTLSLLSDEDVPGDASAALGS